MDSKKNKNISKDVPEKERRSFLKKAVYSAPSLMALGYLAKPSAAKAGDSNIPEGPTWSETGN